MIASAARREGRGHRERGVPCQDAYALRERPGRIVAAVADGLGSRALSHHGSQAAVDAAAESLVASSSLDARALRRAFRSARRALEARAAGLGATPDDLSTTLHLAALSADGVSAASIGDGAVLCADAAPRLLLPPAESEYANLVVPLTAPDWRRHLRLAFAPPASRVLLITDGLTRLLLSRRGGAWEPFAPFFDAFLPRLLPGAFDPGLAERFLATDAIDAAWDDDKCLVVMGL